MSFTKTYFLCPTSDFIHPPPIGPLCLGSIIRSTSAPQFPLNRFNAVAVADAYPPIIETDWKKTVSAETGQGLGVFAQFLRLATLGSPLDADVEVAHTSATGSVFAFDTVTTLSFEPSLEYVGEAVKTPAVQAWLKEPRQRFSPDVSLYLVTGIKLAKGARIRFSKGYKTTVSGHIGVDLSALGAPLTVGPKGHWTSAKADETELSRESEFVFAFCVKRLRFGRKLKVEKYNKGSFMSVGNGEREDDEGVLVEDVDGSDIRTAKVVPDGATENGSVYCALA
ncbi:hypothetical protein GQX73_g6892 [Xylaria multiplex]|uniref:Uncharacterized protein n=1 Tax=Xylaria multiplex TaxID=323545 RepID=A0A7C8MMP2_9PEZI|nr:hypothetical protein GQX73_g6892 [Xylaria multiplex]